jgi:uncharacterized protein YlxW (UPF0749 family)
MTKYLLIVIIGLLMALFIMYSIYDSTKEELSKVKSEKVLLQKEIERRNTNAENLAKHIKDLEKSLEKNRDWADTPVPNNVLDSLQK